MQAKPFLSHILDDEALTRGLGDPEARILVEWLVDQAEELTGRATSEAAVWPPLRQLCRRARAISRFVLLWCHREAYGPAGQLAAAERFHWPLPSEPMDPCELMLAILEQEPAPGAV